MADSYTCKGGRKTAGSNKPTASKESRTEMRINPPAELPKLGKELICPFQLFQGLDGAEGMSPVAGLGGWLPKRMAWVSMCLCPSLQLISEGCAGQKAPALGAAGSWSLGAGREGWRWSLPSERRVSGLTRWVSRRLFIVLVAKCYIKGWKGLNEFRPSAASRVAAPGMEACKRTSPGGPSH